MCPADTFIQKTKKLFQDTRSQRNMAALTADLAEVHTIMSKNIAEVLGQGEKLDSKWLGTQEGFACVVFRCMSWTCVWTQLVQMLVWDQRQVALVMPRTEKALSLCGLLWLQTEGVCHSSAWGKAGCARN